jgi:RNA polymerase sigma factor (sigma-70 family)
LSHFLASGHYTGNTGPFAPGDSPVAALNSILRHVRRIAADPDGAASDVSLLARYAESRDESAFEELLSRHGPLVWGVCTRLLNDRHTAEDAFQATFLVLARRPMAVRRPEALGCWLHGVARRVAGKLRRQSAVTVKEHTPIADSFGTPLDRVTGRELLGLLDEELGNLAVRLRAPLVLCYLEGRTRDEAARALGWSLGTLKRRLEQGKAGLRARLERRGVSLPAAFLAAGVASATVPANLSAATARAASAFVVGKLVGSVPALTADALLRADLLTKLGAVTATMAVVCFALLATVGATASRQRESDEPPAPVAAFPQALEPRPRVNHYGNPLPAGAVARLGSLRFFRGNDGKGWPRLTFSPDGKVIVSSSADNHFWDVATGAEIPVPDQIRRAIPFSAGGRLLAVERRQDVTKFWDVTAGKLVHETTAVEFYGCILGVCPDGKSLVTGQSEHAIFTVRFGRFGDDSLSEPIVLGRRQPLQIAFAADGKTAAVRCGDKSASIFDVNARKEIASFALDEDLGPDIALSPDESALAASTKRGGSLFDCKSGKRLHALHSDKPGQFVTFSPDGKLLAATYPSSIVRLWDPATGKEVRSIHGQGSQVYSTAFSPDGRTLAFSDGGYVTLWDVATGQPRPSFGHTYAIWSFAFSPDGKTLVSGAAYTDKTVRVWDALTGAPKAQWDGHTSGIESVAFTPDGRLVATGSQDGTVRLWDMASNKEVRKLAGPRGMVYGVAIAPAGRTLSAAHAGGGVRLWDVSSGRELRVFEQMPKHTVRLAYTPDGRALLSQASDGNAVSLTDIATGQTLRQFSDPEHPANCFAVSGNGKLLATGDLRRAVTFWDLASGRMRGQTAPVPRQQQGQPAKNWVYGLAFVPDDRSLAVSYQDRSVRVWEIAGRSERARFDGHRDSVLHVAFSPDGSLLASAGSDRTILVWDIAGHWTKPLTLVSDAALSECWNELSADDAAKAFRAMQVLWASGDRGVRLIAAHLSSISAIDAATVNRVVADFDDERFATRQKAETEVVGLGAQAEPALRAALERKPSAEARRRIEAVLDRLDPARSPNALREIRAVEVLERVGTPEARQLLAKLSRGAPVARLTQEAKASLERVKR